MARGGGSKWRELYHSIMTERLCIYEKRLYIMGLYLILRGSLGFAFLVSFKRMHWSILSFRYVIA